MVAEGGVVPCDVPDRGGDRLGDALSRALGIPLIRTGCQSQAAANQDREALNGTSSPLHLSEVVARFSGLQLLALLV